MTGTVAAAVSWIALGFAVASAISAWRDQQEFNDRLETLDKRIDVLFEEYNKLQQDLGNDMSGSLTYPTY